MIYAALLRGINVGGKNKVEMARLAELFRDLGYEKVKTYINSGNVLFASTRPPSSAAIERAVEKTFGFPVNVVLCDLPTMQGLARALPADWRNDHTMQCNVMFLWNEVNNATILSQLAIKPEIDRVKYVKGAVLWSVDRTHITKSGMLKLIGTGLYKKMTIRNCNTLRKLIILMEEMERA